MFNLKSLGGILITALKWAVVWGLAGAAAAALATVIEPDTGHIPRHLVPLMVGVPSAAFGCLAGLLFAAVMAPVRIRDLVGLTGRVILGGFIGGTVGILFMNLLAHSVLTVILAAFLGAVLGGRVAKSGTSLQKK